MEQIKGEIIRVSGPLVVAKGMNGAKMYDVVHVSAMELVGEIIELRGDRASIQVYEDTAGIGPGEPVTSTNQPLNVELGPGLIESIFDGIQRPLDKVMEKTGNLITRGVHVNALDRSKKWDFKASAKPGDKVAGGAILGSVKETTLVEHRIMVPPDVEGVIAEIKSGSFTIEETIARIKDKDGQSIEVSMLQKWPVRKGRPYQKRLAPDSLLSTGQRVIDTFFPVAKGGTASIPGPFGSGKTVVQHQLAKWADAEIIVYIGCGERGNEMTDVLLEFPELKDPKSGEPLMKRTVLVANTSNMPVAAREASIYTGITIAEYFRDMGLNVAVMADSTSRWAEALREISGRLEEMPGEEGYPAYLPTKAADFYERAGRVVCLGNDNREGTLTIIGAVSPPGGDLSDPVVQATLKVVKVYWGLDSKLAYRRHFPAINWLISYSLYLESLRDYFNKITGVDWLSLRNKAMAILEKEAELEEIVRLVGRDTLSPRDQLLLESAKSIREDFLHQIAFDPVDTYASFKKQQKLLTLILNIYEWNLDALERGAEPEKLMALSIRDEIAKAKYTPENQLEKIDALSLKAREEVDKL
ncbi:MAG: V-type sodium ATPase catalytic subunit A [candidate division BRC1 bacterium ADurb.Bin183]|nr:MAG: V-type sodium ATPase catalytic subunit A [candidate division BRC1 bacterium ADurb.Bin183]